MIQQAIIRETNHKVEIRPMSRKDLDEILQIEGSSFPTPWSKRLFEQELDLPHARSFVASDISSEQIVGYLCFWMVVEEAHILNLAVHTDWRRQGVATRLLDEAILYCREKGIQEMTLEVRRSNYKAISLYRNFDFKPQGIRSHYYTDSGEDAVVMGLSLEEPHLTNDP
jgi:[ribosomal protein S18]-alanine N-acetyltransferase